MTAFVPATAVRAIAMLEAAGVPDARRVLADYAAAALVRSYALVINTLEVEGPRNIARGAAVPSELWQRIVREGATHDVWTGGTVRLEPGDLVGGAPAVDITGIGFHQGDLDRLVDHHGARAVTSHRTASASQSPAEAPIADQAQPQRKPPVPPIPPGAKYASVAQAMDTLRFGRTKINEMMNDGRLVKHKIDGATRIEVASIWAVTGVES